MRNSPNSSEELHTNVHLNRFAAVVGCIWVLAFVGTLGCNSNTSLPASGSGSAADSQTKPNTTVSKSDKASRFRKDRTKQTEKGSPTDPASTSSGDPSKPNGNPAGQAGDTATPGTPPVNEKVDAGQLPWITAAKLPMEYWEVQYLNAARIGTTHYRVTASQTQGASLLNITSHTLFEVLRGGEKMRQELTVESIESASGELQSYSEKMVVDGKTVEVSGHVLSGQLQLTKKSGDNSSPISIPWQRSFWGPLGVQEVLLRSPIQPGQQRQFQTFLPQMHKLAKVQLTAGSWEDTNLPGGISQQLLPVAVVMQVDKEELRSEMWINESGEVIKTVVLSGINLSSFRVPREIAERIDSEAKVDLMTALAISLEKPIANAKTAKRIVYLVEAENFDPYSSLSQQSNQQVKSMSARSTELTVTRLDPGAFDPGASLQAQPGSEHIHPSPVIESDDPVITRLAKELVGTAESPTDQAIALAKGIQQKISKKNFSRSFDSAKEVAVALEGDCTEHAVLLAACLRSRGIPSRVASGLIYVDKDSPQFVYHMWTEAWVGNAWLPLDATLGDIAGPDHIKFLESALADANPYSALLPILNSLGKLKITVVRTE